MCLFEANNLFDMFAIRICRKDCEKKVGHLPTEISRPTKYPRGEKIIAKLWSIHYRRSPLFQEGLEIPCGVAVTISASIKGHLLMQRYEKWYMNSIANPKMKLQWIASLRTLMLIVIHNRKRKRKKTLENLFENPRRAKTFDISSKNHNVKKIHLCLIYV